MWGAGIPCQLNSTPAFRTLFLVSCRRKLYKYRTIALCPRNRKSCAPDFSKSNLSTQIAWMALVWRHRVKTFGCPPAVVGRADAGLCLGSVEIVFDVVEKIRADSYLQTVVLGHDLLDDYWRGCLAEVKLIAVDQVVITGQGQRLDIDQFLRL